MKPSNQYETASFTSAQTGYVLCVGVISGMVPTLQPILLGQLATEAKISLAEIGQAAMLEALGMLISVSLAGAFLKAERLKVVTIAAIVSMISINIATAQLSGSGLLIARFAAGLSAGVLLWIWIGMLARVSLPGRLASIYVMLQTALLLASTTILSKILLPSVGAQGGYVALAVFFGALVLFVPYAPNRYALLETAKGIALPSARGLLGLGVICLHMAAYMGLWVYVVPLAKKSGLSNGAEGLAISLAICAQFGAGFAAGLLAARFNAAIVLICSVTVCILALGVLSVATTDFLFIATIGFFAFFWMLAIPFEMPYLLMVDPSRKAAMQIVSAQLLGVAAGPALASIAVEGSDVGRAIGVSAALFAVAGIIVIATVIRSSRAGEVEVDLDAEPMAGLK